MHQQAHQPCFDKLGNQVVNKVEIENINEVETEIMKKTSNPKTSSGPSKLDKG